MHRLPALLSIALLTVACNETGESTPVRALLLDGQVMVGEVETDTLYLESALGTLPIPLADVGEVLPVEGTDLKGSSGYVTVWLRNGSELRGKWADPELRMGLEIGGSVLAVDLPANELTRFQMQGGEIWPEAPVYRVRTHSGDDFLVDPDASRIEVTNELGTFAPYLSECASIVPNGDSWTLTLHTGTVLKGTLTADTLDFDLEVGPPEVAVPVDQIVSMSWEDWGGAYANQAPAVMAAPRSSLGGVSGEFEVFEERPAEADEGERYQRIRSIDKGDGWFSNGRLYDAKH